MSAQVMQRSVVLGTNSEPADKPHSVGVDKFRGGIPATGAFPFCGLVLCVYASVCEDLLASSDFRVMDWGVQFQSGR
jgi:hypothetical protein